MAGDLVIGEEGTQNFYPSSLIPQLSTLCEMRVTIETVIHRRWRGSAALCRLVPPERFCTGLVPGRDSRGWTIELPYAVLRLDSEPPSQRTVRTSSGTLLVETSCEFHVYATNIAEGRDIGSAIRECFTSADFYWSQGHVQDMRPEAQAVEQLEDGLWHLVQKFSLRYEVRK